MTAEALLEQIARDVQEMKARVEATDRILDSKDVAELLKCDQNTVTRMARKGKLPAKFVGKGWLFSERAILELIRKGEKD